VAWYTHVFEDIAFTSSFGFHSNPDLIAIYEPINPNLMFSLAVMADMIRG
jgi:hypothetical protein